jgi:outer membrane protein assembly factor BamB
LGGQTLAAPAGRSSHQIKDAGASEALASALGALRIPALPERKRMPEAVGRLEAVAQRQLESPVESVWVGKTGAAGEVLVIGQRNGEVQAMDANTLKPAWTYRCGNVVNSIDAGDLMGDGKTEIVVGSDDYHVHALAADGTLLWRWKAPFDEIKARSAYNQWLWPEPFVKKVAVHDLNKDGKAEVVAGTGMNTFGVDGRGKQLWAFRDNKEHCPCMRAIVFADVNKDGVDEPVGGTSDMWYDGSMWAIGRRGEEVLSYRGDGWCSGARVAIAEDLLGKGGRSLVFGTRRGGVWCYPDICDTSKRWFRFLGDQVDHLATLKRGDGPSKDAPSGRLYLIVAAGGDTKWVTAFGPTGRREWAVYFDAAVTAMTANAAKDKLCIGCEDGRAYELDAGGRILRSVHLDGTPTTMSATAAGPVAVGTRQGGLFLIR